jgi:hypothetical protein
MFHKINGSAGCGKTHAIIGQIKTLYKNNSNFILVTPTNKAAMVLNDRLAKEGLPRFAKTIHSTIYNWKKTDIVKGVIQKRVIDPLTSKFKVDSNGKPVYTTETEYVWISEIKSALKGFTIIIDESSMVSGSVWYDIIESDLFGDIYSYGDEKQLPPIEEIKNMPELYKKYYLFWSTQPADTTLAKNYRQSGTLKDFLDICESSIFESKFKSGFPVPLLIGGNYTTHANDLHETDLVTEMLRSDIIITPFNKVRNLCNIICRKQLATKAGKRFIQTPVVGDKIILTDPIRRERDNGKYKELYLAKNVCATITAIIDLDLLTNSIIVDMVDETGVKHKAEPLSLNTVLGNVVKNEYAKFDYAYAVTVHAAQGGQWGKVLFLDSNFPSNLDKLRYVAITRATESIGIITGITNMTEAADASKSIVVRASQL